MKIGFRRVSFHVIFSSVLSQGGVRFPTGGIPEELSGEPASASASRRRVSRFGEKPKPTVRVRTKENENASRAFLRPDSCNF